VQKQASHTSYLQNNEVGKVPGSLSQAIGVYDTEALALSAV